jgi:hypothetical protein
MQLSRKRILSMVVGLKLVKDDSAMLLYQQEVRAFLAGSFSRWEG